MLSLIEATCPMCLAECWYDTAGEPREKIGGIAHLDWCDGLPNIRIKPPYEPKDKKEVIQIDMFGAVNVSGGLHGSGKLGK